MRDLILRVELSQNSAHCFVNLLISNATDIPVSSYHGILVVHTIEILSFIHRLGYVSEAELVVGTKELRLKVEVVADIVQLFKILQNIISHSLDLNFNFANLLCRIDFKSENRFLKQSQSWTKKQSAYKSTYPSNHVHDSRTTIINESKLVEPAISPDPRGNSGEDKHDQHDFEHNLHIDITSLSQGTCCNGWCELRTGVKHNEMEGLLFWYVEEEIEIKFGANHTTKRLHWKLVPKCPNTDRTDHLFNETKFKHSRSVFIADSSCIYHDIANTDSKQDGCYETQL